MRVDTGEKVFEAGPVKATLVLVVIAIQGSGCSGVS